MFIVLKLSKLSCSWYINAELIITLTINQTIIEYLTKLLIENSPFCIFLFIFIVSVILFVIKYYQMSIFYLQNKK